MPFGEHSLSVVLRSCEPTRIEAVRPELLRIAAAADARFHRETYNGLNAWFAMAPGNHGRQLRHNYLSAAVAADLAPLWAVSEGDPRDRHLGDEHLAIFETSRRTPFYYAAHAGDIAHTLVIGATGSGKSFLLNFLLAQGRKYDPRVCILDLGGSYRQLTELVGGAYLHLQLGLRRAALRSQSVPRTRADRGEPAVLGLVREDAAGNRGRAVRRRPAGRVAGADPSAVRARAAGAHAVVSARPAARQLAQSAGRLGPGRGVGLGLRQHRGLS